MAGKMNTILAAAASHYPTDLPPLYTSSERGEKAYLDRYENIGNRIGNGFVCGFIYSPSENSMDSKRDTAFPATHALEISSPLRYVALRLLPKRPTDTTDASPSSFGLFVSVYESTTYLRGRISFASPPVRASLTPSSPSASLWQSFTTFRSCEEMSRWLTPQFCIRIFFTCSLL